MTLRNAKIPVWGNEGWTVKASWQVAELLKKTLTVILSLQLI